MSLTSIIYFSSILLTCLLTGFLAWYAWQQPALPGVRTYAWIAASECLLTLATIFSMLSGTQAQALFWFKIRFIFSALIPALWFVLSLQYNGYKNWLSKRVMIGMFIIPIISQGMLWTNDLHGLWVRQEVTFYSNGPFWIAEISARIPGMMYMVNTVYSLILGLAGIGLMIFMAWSKSRRYRNQALLISIATLTALAAFVIPTFNLFPQNEFSPLVPGMGISSLLFAFVIFKFQFLKRPAAEEGATITRNLEPDEKKSLIRLLFVFVLFTTGFAVISYSAYQNYETQFRAQIEKQLSAIGMLKVDELQNWRQERLADASIFYQNDNFSEQVKTYLKNPQDTEARNNLLTWMKKLQAVPEYDRIFLLDPQGRERISIPAEPKAVPPNLVTQSAASLAANKIIFLDFHRHSDKDGVYLSILIPIFDGSQPLGVLVLRINPKIYLYPFIQRWPVPSQSAETLLVRQDGGDIVYLSELKFKLGAVLSLRTSLENKNIPAVKAALGFEGLTEGVDYRGVEVVGDVRAVPDSPWFLVSKIDKDEVYAPLRERMFQASLFTCLLILAVGMGLASIWRQQRVRYLHSQMDTLNALRTSDEKFKLTFDTSPDLITITRFSDGMFTSVNKGFEKNSGFTQEDVIGKTTSEVNIWKDVEDRRRLVEELQAKGEVRNYEAPLITKNGEIYGLMSASIIQLNGVPHVLTITRDITERKRAEGQIRKLSRAVEQSPASIVITDLQGNIEYANPRFTQVTGYSLEEVLGKTPRILKSGYTPDEEYKKLWEIITTGNIWQGEFLDKKKSGETYWENATITPVVDDNGKVTNFLAIKEDITERRRVGEALRESEARYRTLIENMGEGIGFVDAQEQFLFVNPAGHEIFGMPADSLAGHNLKEFTTPDQFNLMLEQTQQRLAGEKTSYEIEINRPDGKKYNLLVTAVPRFDSHGQYIGALGVFRNLTERKQAEEALHRAEENYRGIFENALEGIFQSQPQGQFIKVNPAFARMLGYASPDEMVEAVTDIASQTYVDAPQRHKFMQVMGEQGAVTGFEIQMKRKDGDTIWVSESARAVRDETGNILYYEGAAEDITERKRTEQILRESEENTRIAYDAAQLGTWKNDIILQTLNLDKRARQHYDVDEECTSQQAIASRIHPQDAPRLRQEILATILDTMDKKDGELSTEYRVIHRDGSIHWLSIHARTRFEEREGKRQPVLINGTSQDITARKDSEQQLIHRTQQLRLINEATSRLNTSLEARHVYDVIYSSISQLMPCNTLFISSFDPTHNLITLTSGWHDGQPLDISHYEPIPLEPEGSGTQSQVIRSKEALLVPDFQARLKNTQVVHNFNNEGNPEDSPPENEDIPRSALVAPLLVEGRALGVIQVFSYRINAYTEEDLKTLKGFSAQAAIALSNAELYEHLQQENLERKQAEEALQKSEEKYRTLIQGIQVGVVVHNPDSSILFSNSKASELLGLTFDQMLGKTAIDPYWRFIREDGTDMPLEEYPANQVLSSTRPLSNLMLGILRSDQEEPVWVQCNAHQNLDIDGRIQQVVVTFIDITETKQAEKALRESEQKYRLLFDEMLSGVAVHEIICDPQGKPIDYRFIAINSAFEKMTGLISSAVIGKRVREIMPATEPNWIERYGKVALTRIPTQFEDYSVEINKYFEVRAFSPEKGKFATIFHDVTERKQAEEKLHSAHELMQSVQDSLSAHITTLDHEGNIVQVNSAWRNFGAQNGLNHSNHCIGMNYLQICDAARGVDAEEASTAAYAIREVLNGTKKEMRFEYPCHAPNEYGWFIAHITSFENNGKKWVVVSHENITERKQAEENISLRMTELELLYENSMTFNQSLNPKEIAQKVIELLSEKLDWHHTALRLFNEQDNSLELTAFDMQGLGDEEEKETLSHLSKLITHISEGLSGWAIEQGKTLRIGDVNSDPHYVSSYPGIQSGLYAPLRSGKRVMGVISIESKKPNAFSEADEQLITTLANQAGIALENARLYREISSYAEKLEQRVQERTAEIEATQRRLELAVETAGIGIWELDIKQNKDYWDDRLFALYGLSRETSEPEPETWRKAIHPDDLNEQLNLMDEALRNNQPYNTEFRVVLPNGNIRYIKSTGRVIPDATGNADRMIGANQDITIHKQAEETLSLANAEMERGLRMKNEFLANMSHELRTPLNAILGISESLEEQISGTLNEKQLGYIRTVIESGRHLLDLINDILDLSKIEAGKLELNIQSISVEKLCTASLRMVKELAQKKSLNVSFKMDQNAQQILGDERRLKQSLVNLLGNAVKFTPSGKRIGLEVKGNAQANEITFTIWDEGIGIKQENIQRLFKPFVQLNAGLAREYAGTGLGLALVAQMVLLHGGHIDLKSELNTGSRFTITLPWMPKEQVIQMPVKHQVLEGNRTPKIKRAGKILIVDDTEVVAQLMSEYLRHKGYETLIAANGREGVMLASQEHPQVILMDVMMPIMNGLDATKKIRADASLRDIPIIGLTALAMSSDREQCLAAGMNDHISKPVEMQELVKIIERYLAQSD